jgi:SAM domain (Sterile alpha motif)
VESWTIQDVGEWLQSMSLSQYIAAFSANEISGPVLIDLGLDDLDYLGITILAHRKVILKGVEDLRKNKRVTLKV